jgi:Glycine cleavage H-protein
VVFAQLPDPGAELSQMGKMFLLLLLQPWFIYYLIFNITDDCGALESVKAASELFCPVTGVVVEKNAEVEETPGLINQSPYEKGWLFKIELSKPEEVDSLLDEAGYQKHLTDQGH